MNYSIYESKKRKIIPTVNSCFCLNLKNSIIAFSILLIIWYNVLNLIYVYVVYDKKFYVPVVVNVIIIVSLIILLCGIFTKKILLIKQLQYHYPLYLVYSILNITQYIIGIFSDSSHEALNDKIVELFHNKHLSKDTRETYIKMYQCSFTTIALFMLIIYFYFYIVLYSYIQKVERIIEIQEQKEYSRRLAGYI